MVALTKSMARRGNVTQVIVDGETIFEVSGRVRVKGRGLLMREWAFENANGDTLDLNADPYTVIDFSGIGVPQIEQIEDELVDTPGFIPRSARIESRSLSLQVLVEATDAPTSEEALHRLLTHVSGSHGQIALASGVLHSVNFRLQNRSLRCSAIAGMELLSRDVQGFGYSLPLEFSAPHPFWYDPNERGVTSASAVAGQLTFPIEFPVAFGPDGPSSNYRPALRRNGGN